MFGLLQLTQEPHCRTPNFEGPRRQRMNRPLVESSMTVAYLGLENVRPLFTSRKAPYL